MIRKLVVITMAVLLLAMAVGCAVLQKRSGLDNSEAGLVISTEIEELVTEYIEEKVAHKVCNGSSFAAVDIYGSEQRDDDETQVYLWAYYMEYYLANGHLQQGGGASLPLVIVLAKDDSGNYFVSEHYEPRDGSEYGSSVRRLFPEDYHDAIFSRSNVHDLESLVRQRAEAHFKRHIIN